MDWQLLFNLMFGVVCAGSGFLVNKLWVAVTDLQSADMKLSDKVNSIEINITSHYLHKDEFVRFSDAIFNKLDKIYDKLESKVDR